jgi:hypothetical protein
VHGADAPHVWVNDLTTFLPGIHHNAKAFAEASFRRLRRDQRQRAQHFLVVLYGKEMLKWIMQVC